MKTIHKIFFLANLEKLMKEWPVFSHIVMNSVPIFPGEKPPMVIEYKDKSQKVHGFIATEGGRSNEAGVPYLSPLPIFF